MAKKLIPITTLDQLQVGSIIVTPSNNKQKVLAKVDQVVALSEAGKYGSCWAWYTLQDLKYYQQEIEDKPWQPKDGEVCYFPHIWTGKADYYGVGFGTVSTSDQDRLAAGMCFKTAEAAKAAAQKMLNILKPKEL